MSRDTIRLVVLGVVVIAAIGMGAATITSTIAPGQGGGTTPGDWGANGESTEDGGNNEPPGSPPALTPNDDDRENQLPPIQRCVQPLAKWYGTLAYFGAFAVLLLAIKRRYSLGAAFMAMYAIAPVALVAYFLSTSCATLGPTAGNVSGTPGGDGPTNPPIAGLDIPPIAVVGVFALVLAAAAVVLVRASGDQRVVQAEEEDGVATDEPHVSDLAAAAGAAADRLEQHNVDVDNEVYRAWGEMTRLLNVPNPDSSTPGEFAEAAIDVGVNRDDVEQLTRLFEEVRYGKRDPESREELAIEVFRRIESEYGAGGADNDTEDNDGY